MDAEKYIAIKEAAQRYTLLKEAVLNFRENDKEFFLAAFKRERFLDIKLTALRGYTEYASEKDVNVLMTKMLELLIKRRNQIDFFFFPIDKTGEIYYNNA